MVLDRDGGRSPNGCTSNRAGSGRGSSRCVQRLEQHKLGRCRPRRDSSANALAQFLMLDELVHVTFHQLLNEIDVFHLLEGMRADDVLNIDDILVFESGENLHFAQRPLAEALMFERRELLDRHALAGEAIESGDDHAVRSFANVLQIGVPWTDLEQLIFD